MKAKLTLKRTCMILLLAVASIFICSLFTEQNSYAYADDSPAYLSSESLENDCDYGHLARIDFIRTETIGGKSVEVKYYPVFDAEHYPEGAHFFGADGTEFTSMDPNITYAMTPGGRGILAVRDIQNVSYNSVYGTGGTRAKHALEIWKTANLATDEFVEPFLEASDYAPEPKINDIGLTTIWKALNPKKSTAGFGGSFGRFWSCVEFNEKYAWYWYSYYGKSGDWHINGRDDTWGDNMCVCVSRVF